MTMVLAQSIAEQYIDAYNLADADARAAAVAALWTGDARHVGGFTAQGHDDIAKGIAGIAEQIAAHGARFRLRPGTSSRDELLVLLWELVSGSGEILDRGATVAVTTPDARIRTEYVFEFAADGGDREASQQLARRFVHAWNEPDDGARAELVRELWTPAGVHLGGFVGTGHDELTDGINESHRRQVRGNRLRFRERDGAMRRGDTVFFVFDVESVEQGAIVASGLQVVHLDDAGRIRKDATMMLAALDGNS